MRTVEEINKRLACKAKCDGCKDDSSCTETFDNFCDDVLAYTSLLGGIPLSRLSEICSAEKDGRVVVMPCKVGDKCYIIIPRYDSTSQFLGILPASTKVAKMTVWGIEIRDGSLWITDGDRYSGELGKTVFLTRAAAEEKMKGEADD